MTPIRRLHLHIRGRVQGVSFRYYVQQRARTLGLFGWVRNSEDGSVEIVIQGAVEALEQFLAWAHRGPSMARVDEVEVVQEEPDEAAHSFRIVG